MSKKNDGNPTGDAASKLSAEEASKIQERMRAAELKFGGSIASNPSSDGQTMTSETSSSSSSSSETASTTTTSQLPSYKSKKTTSGGAGATSSSSSSSSAKAGFATATSLGIQYNSEEQGNIYNRVATINGYTFDIPPVNRFHSKTAEQKFSQLTGGSVNPVKFEADRFDNIRERLQTADKRSREGNMQAIAVLYAENLGNTFTRTRNLVELEKKGEKVDNRRDGATKGIAIDYALLERCFYPTYVPTYAEALRATGLVKPWPFWRQGLFSSLEVISRLPLDRCDVNREMLMSFEEWYGLFWNYYQPFNIIAYLCTVTAQSMVYTREFIDSLADYLAERHALIEDPRLKKSPILFLGAKTGKMGALLNLTKKLPVPVIHTHESPNTNPYLLVIPPDKQRDFMPSPIIKLKNQQALEKYEPAIVLLSDMINHEDPTVQIRQQGSVREYYYFGVPDSYIEGHAWDTWGYFKYREQRDANGGNSGGGGGGKKSIKERLSTVPPFMEDGFVKLTYPHLSRWMLHKLDSHLQMGNATVTGWLRRPVLPTFKSRMGYRLARLKPIF